MSYEEISAKHVVGKKEYSCVWCGEIIKVKEKHLKRFYKMEGEAKSDRMHLECEDAMYKMPWDYLCDGFMQGEFKRGTFNSKARQ